MKTSTVKTLPSEPKWIHLDEGKKRLYVYVHPDPAIHERFSIERVFVPRKVSPHFLIRDKLGRVIGSRKRLFNAQLHVEESLQRELQMTSADIRIVVHNEYVRGNTEKALMAIIDHFEKMIEDKAREAENDLDDFKYDLRRVGLT